ncbi:hypothetical protein ABT354_01290 [Streptomyces sp. NPDC000594]|uniref:hypothetical protein n=1 Tax=Streptomyces sp. NPDC000594 TaxID=3154261 RepID=UPI00332431F3
MIDVEAGEEEKHHGPEFEVEVDERPVRGLSTCRCGPEEPRMMRSEVTSLCQRILGVNDSVAGSDNDPADTALLALEELAAEEKGRKGLDQALGELQIQYIRQVHAYDLLIAIRLEGVPPEDAERIRRAADILSGVRTEPRRPG